MFGSILRDKMPRYSPLRASTNSKMVEKHETTSSSDEENEPFMRGPRPHPAASRYSWLRSNWSLAFLHSVLITTNVVLLIVSGATYLKRHDPQHASTPLEGRIRFENHKWDHISTYLSDGSLNPKRKTDFNGPPRPALEEAWAKLKAHDNVRVSKEELGQFADDDTIIELSDGSGYYTTVAVFHGLHCIQRLHHYLYPDHYYPNLTETEGFLLKRHTEHCLDWLRQYVMCNADTTLIPIHWTPESPSPAALDVGDHKCVVWEDVEEWMAKHSFNPFEPGLLVHPKFGNPFDTDPSHDHKNLGVTDGGQHGVNFIHAGHAHD